MPAGGAVQGAARPLVFASSEPVTTPGTSGTTDTTNVGANDG
jgi:hypothetical protein